MPIWSVQILFLSSLEWLITWCFFFGGFSGLSDAIIHFLFINQDLNLSAERLSANKAFTNKLWNAGKFMLQNLPSQSDVFAWETLRAYEVGIYLFLEVVGIFQTE